MDCQAFDSSLLDALYDEHEHDAHALDGGASTAIDEHAASCASCAERIRRLRRTQELIRPALELPSPEGLEAKIFAAVERAEAAKSAPAVAEAAVVPLDEHRIRTPAREAADAGPRDESRRPGGVIAFLSRPQFAIAAAFLLVLGATALFTGGLAKKSAAPAAAQAEREDSPAAPPPPVVAATAAPTTAASALALATPPPAAPRALAPTPKPTPAEGRLDDDFDRQEAKLDAKQKAGGGRTAVDPAAAGFTAAKSLYDAGKYAEALPRFDALSGSHPEADLYAARCVAKTRGCSAAAPRYDRYAQTHAGTERGSRAALEVARCLRTAGQTAAAKPRYQALLTDNYVAQEANAELHALDAPAPVQAKPARPAATTTAPANIDVRQ